MASPQKRKLAEPWEIDIGRLTKPWKDRDGVEQPPKIVIHEIATTIQAGKGPVVQKQDLADIMGCGVDDRCWAVVLSIMTWSLKLQLCNHHTESRHACYDSDAHVFEPEDIRAINAHIKQLAADQGSTREE